MNISKIFMLDEVNIVYGKRNLSYFSTGYSYWYNGIEISNKEYSKEKWNKIKKRFNDGFACKIDKNEEYSFEVARQADLQIQNACQQNLKKVY